VLAKLHEKEQTKEDKKSEEKQNSMLEILKEEQECPNCHFARFKMVDREISCPVCGYGHKRCG
jgi:rubredoxin